MSLALTHVDAGAGRSPPRHACAKSPSALFRLRSRPRPPPPPPEKKPCDDGCGPRRQRIFPPPPRLRDDAPFVSENLMARRPWGGLSFELDAAMPGLLGPNFAGKTTTCASWRPGRPTWARSPRGVDGVKEPEAGDSASSGSWPTLLYLRRPFGARGTCASGGFDGGCDARRSGCGPRCDEVELDGVADDAAPDLLGGHEAPPALAPGRPSRAGSSSPRRALQGIVTSGPEMAQRVRPRLQGSGGPWSLPRTASPPARRGRPRRHSRERRILSGPAVRRHCRGRRSRTVRELIDAEA